jgi:predicted PurR-regulated permease PerM
MDQKGITWGGLGKVLLFIILVAVLYLARNIFIALFLAIVISSALDPIVSRLEKRKIPRILGTLSVYLMVMFFIALVIYAVLPLAISELNTLLKSFGEISGSVFEFIDATTAIEAINKSLNRVADILLSGGASLLDISSKFLGGLTLTASVLVLSFYLTVGKDGVEKFLITVTPTAYESRVLDLYFRIRRKIGRWLAGQVLLSLAIGVAVFLGLWILGVKYSLILGLIAGILEIVPYVGPIFSGGLAVMIGLTDSLTLGIYTLILFIVIQQIENHILVPAVTNWTTQLNPVIILVSLLIGAQIFGFVGLILAVPAAVLLQEVVENWATAKDRRRGLGL